MGLAEVVGENLSAIILKQYMIHVMASEVLVLLRKVLDGGKTCVFGGYASYRITDIITLERFPSE